jgi:hypothetical protein
MQDITSQVLAQRAVSVSDLLIDPSQITPIGFVNCTMFLLHSIWISPYDAASDDAIYSIFDALSIIMSGDELKIFSDFELAYIARTIEELSSFRKLWLVVGETSPEIITENVRVNIKKDFYYRISGSILEWPKSNLEIAYDIQLGGSNLLHLDENVPADKSLVAFDSVGYNSVLYTRNIMVIFYYF